MAMSIRFCLSNDHFKLDFIAFKVDKCSRETACGHGRCYDVTFFVPAKVLLHVWLYNFYDTALSIA